MNILQITNSLRVGGAERLLTEYIPQLRRKHHVEVLVLQDKESFFEKELCDSGVRLHCLKIKSLYSPTTIFRIRRFLKKNPQFDVLHVHLFPSLYWVALAAKGLNGRLVWTEHSTSNKRRNKWFLQPIERYIYSCYDRIVCISNATLASIAKWMGIQPDSSRLTVIENGVNLEKFRRTDCGHKYSHTLIQVSRFEPSKDQDTVIRAMRYLDSDIHLIFVGDGSRLEYCKALSRELNVSDRVHFLGMQTDIRDLLSSADVAIQSSHWEGFGLTAVEAMANGLPVVASDVDGLRQVVADAGILFPAGNETELANAIEVLFADTDLYHKVSMRCLQRAEKFSIENMTERYINVYESVLSG